MDVSQTAIVAPAHPWRRTARTLLAFVLALAPTLPGIVSASGVSDASPWVATALSIGAGVTRVMGLPQTELLLRRFAPWLAAGDVQSDKVVAQVVDVQTNAEGGAVLESTELVAGEAHAAPTGSPITLTTAVDDDVKPPRKRRAHRNAR